MYLIQNIQIPMQNYYLKLLNMCKFTHDRKTHIILHGWDLGEDM